MDITSRAALRGALALVRYKPDTSFTIQDNDSFNWFSVVVKMKIVDADNFERSDYLQSVWRVRLPITLTRLLSDLRDFLGTVEMHERDEFFRFQEEKIFDPHKPLL